MTRDAFWHKALDHRLSRRAMIRAAGPRAADFALRPPRVAPATIRTTTSAQMGNRKAWPVLRGVSVAGVELPARTWRAPHLHTNAPELAVIVQGSARAGLQDPQKEWLEVELQAGDCVYFPLGWPHWLRNTGSAPLLAYFNYGHEQPETVERDA